jgi:hypothetical protein
MVPGRQFVSRSHLEKIEQPMRRNMKTRNDPRVFQMVKLRLQIMTLEWADERSYYEHESARSLLLLAVSECSQLCEIFLCYKDKQIETKYNMEIKRMAAEEIADIFLTLLQFTYAEIKERETCRNQLTDQFVNGTMTEMK